jgi:hypothetical protein
LLKAINAIQHIRDHPRMYLPDGKVSGEYLLSKLVLDALFLGVRDIRVQHINEWWLIGSSANLFPEDSGELITLFTQVVPFPEAGVNSMRTEVLLTAFAQDVIIRNGINRTVIAGRIGLDEPVWQLMDNCGCERVVGFRIRDEN